MIKFNTGARIIFIIILTLMIVLQIQSCRLSSVKEELSAQKTENLKLMADNTLLYESVNACETGMFNLSAQAAENDAICRRQLADRGKIQSIIKPVKMPAAAKATPVNGELEATAETAAAIKNQEIITYETSINVIGFINAHLQ